MAGRQVTIERVSDALAWARQACEANPATLTLETAQAILAHVTGKGRAWLFAHRDTPLTAAQSERFMTLLSRAADGEPLAYLVGQREFWGLPFAVTPDVLIPRPETEALVEVVLDWVRRHELPAPSVADVGTGSGAIAIALALELPLARLTAIEISAEALEVARSNAVRHGVADRVAFVQGDLLSGQDGPFDAIVANLPYISQEELSALEVGRWEPRVALDGGPDGLELIRRLLRQAPPLIRAGGLVALEIGYDQGKRAVELCRQAFPTAQITLLPDLAGLDRIVRVEV